MTSYSHKYENQALPHEEIFVSYLPKHQITTECIAVSVYTCIHFLACICEAESKYAKNKNTKYADDHLPSFENLSTQVSFFLHNLKMGFAIWKNVVESRRFTSSDSQEAYSIRYAQQLHDNPEELFGWFEKTQWCKELTVPGWGKDPIDFYGSDEKFDELFTLLRNQVIVSLPVIEYINTLKPAYPPSTHVNQNFLLDELHRLPRVDGLKPELFLDVSEIFYNCPGLCVLDYSEVCKSVTLLVPFLKYEDVLNRTESILLFLKEIGVSTTYEDDYEWIPDDLVDTFVFLETEVSFYKKSFLNTKMLSANAAQNPNKLDLNKLTKIAVAIHSATCYFIFSFINSRSSALVEQDKIKIKKHVESLGLVDPNCQSQSDRQEGVLSYTVETFLQMLQQSVYSHEHFKRMRAFVLTRAGKSVSLMCDLKKHHFLIFDSHMHLVDDANISKVYLAKNIYACLALLLDNILIPSQQICMHVDMEEICLTEKSFNLMSTNCDGFLDL